MATSTSASVARASASASSSLSSSLLASNARLATSGIYSHPTLSSSLIDTAALASSSRSKLPAPRPPPARRCERFTPSYPTPLPQPSPPLGNDGGNGAWIPDHEFNIRLSRAVSLLRATLSDFMRIGLVDYDTSHVSSSSSSSGLGIPALDRLGLGAILEAFGARSSAKARERQELPAQLRTDDDCPFYHPNIVFKFRPPTASLPDDVNHVDSGLVTFTGRTMYFGSAHVLRLALSALFAQTSVNIERVHLQRPEGPTAAQREASLMLRMTFNGVVRVTHQVHEYTVVFRYNFDPATGLIIQHTVDRIEPAPGKKIYAGLAAAFARLAGRTNPQPAPVPYCAATTRAREAAAGVHSVGLGTPVPALAFLPRSNAARRGGNVQRRRGYATQSKRNEAAASAAVKAAAQASEAPAPSTSTFFSTPTGANDMPGPSLSSFLFPWGSSREATIEQRHTRWAPSSDDPTQVSLRSPATTATQEDPSTAAPTAYRPAPSPSFTRIIAGLSKARLTFLVTLSAMAGYALCPAYLAAAQPGSGVITLLLLTAGTALCSASANAINQLREIPYDAQMARTRGRLLPSRSVTPLYAATFAATSATTGVATLSLLSPVTAGLGLANIILYSFIYTPLKRTSLSNTWLGAIVGALPPLMGWSACTGGSLFDVLGADAPAWVLAAVLYAWQFPHFNALAHNLAAEYARGGYRMMSVLDPALNRRVALRHAIALLPICGLALPLSGAVYPWAYAALSLPPNVVFLAATWQFWKKGDAGSARWCFWVSLVHLPAVMIAAMLCKRGLWDWVVGEEGESESEE